VAPAANGVGDPADPVRGAVVDGAVGGHAMAAVGYDDTKKAFRVKGKLDAYEYKAVSLIPMGEGDFIMAVNWKKAEEYLKAGKG